MGVLAYELLIGVSPFHSASSRQDIALNIVSQQPGMLESMSLGARSFIQRVLSKVRRAYVAQGEELHPERAVQGKESVCRSGRGASSIACRPR